MITTLFPAMSILEINLRSGIFNLILQINSFFSSRHSKTSRDQGNIYLRFQAIWNWNLG